MTNADYWNDSHRLPVTEVPLTLEVFSHDLNAEWNRSGKSPRDKLVVAAMGMSGEAGEVLEHFKKYIRDGKSVYLNREVALELGDVLHYWCRLVYETGFTVEEVMKMNVEKLEARRATKEAEAACERDE